jgi:hypothetical protein
MPAIAQEPTDRGDLVVRLQRVTAAVWDFECHLVRAKFDLQVVVPGFFRRAAE